MKMFFLYENGDIPTIQGLSTRQYSHLVDQDDHDLAVLRPIAKHYGLPLLNYEPLGIFFLGEKKMWAVKQGPLVV